MNSAERAKWLRKIADEVENDPSRWTKWASAKDFAGVKVKPTDPAARCWCASGFVNRDLRDDPIAIGILVDLHNATGRQPDPMLDAPYRSVPNHNDYLKGPDEFVAWFRKAAEMVEARGDIR